VSKLRKNEGFLHWISLCCSLLSLINVDKAKKNSYFIDVAMSFVEVKTQHLVRWGMANKGDAVSNLQTRIMSG
jgi:hypothetical protein